MDVDEGEQSEEDSRAILGLSDSDRQVVLDQVAIRHCHYRNPEKEFDVNAAKDELSRGSYSCSFL